MFLFKIILCFHRVYSRKKYICIKKILNNYYWKTMMNICFKYFFCPNFVFVLLFLQKYHRRRKVFYSGITMKYLHNSEISLKESKCSVAIATISSHRCKRIHSKAWNTSLFEWTSAEICWNRGFNVKCKLYVESIRKGKWSWRNFFLSL